MTPGVWLTSFQAAALPDVLRAQADRLRYVYLESPTRVALTPFADSPEPWQHARHGRAFGPTAEIRWRWTDMLSIEAQILWEENRAPPDVPEQRVKWSASDWNARFETTPRPRVVLLIDRPDSTLHCLDYLCEGIVVLTRLCDVTPLPSPPSPHPQAGEERLSRTTPFSPHGGGKHRG